MFADPQSITISGNAQSFPRVGSEQPTRRGTFRTSDGLLSFDVRQDKTANRCRREVRLTQTKIAADPISNQNKQVSASVIIAIDEPVTGFTDADIAALSNGLTAWFTAANRDKLLGGEL